MGQISRNTFKKLTLLYFVGRFREGAYSSYRVQKVLYFGIRDLDRHPFHYRYTDHGQYSRDIRKNLNSLAAIGLVDITELPETEEQGAKWAINPRAIDMGFSTLLAHIDPKLALSLDKSIEEIGYLKNEEIKKRAHEDPLLKNTPFGHILFDENLPDFIDIDLSDDECEDLELALNQEFIICMSHLVSGIEATDFNIKEVERVISVL